MTEPPRPAAPPGSTRLERAPFGTDPDTVARLVARDGGVIIGEEAWPYVLSPEEIRTHPEPLRAPLGFRSISFRGEQPGFPWRVAARPLEEHLSL